MTELLAEFTGLRTTEISPACCDADSGYGFVESADANGSQARVTTAAEVPVAAHDKGCRRRPMLLAYAATLLAIVALIVAEQISWYRKAADANRLTLSAKASAPVTLRKSVAVLGFQNVTGKAEDTWLGTAFAEMLSTELAGRGTLRLVSVEDVANPRHASPWPQTDSLDEQTTKRIGIALNSDVLVLGSYTAIGKPDQGQMRLAVRLQDAKTGEILRETAETGSTQNLLDMSSRVGGKLRDKLSVPRLEAQEKASASATVFSGFGENARIRVSRSPAGSSSR